MNPGERRLAAIVVADVVGYSRLMADDEEGTLHLIEESLSHFCSRRGPASAFLSHAASL